MQIIQKNYLKLIITFLITLLTFTFVMPIKNMDGITAFAYEQKYEYFNVNGGSFKASHSNARYYSCSANWVSVTGDGSNRGDSYKITIKPSTDLSSTLKRRSTSFDLLDSNKNVIRRYWIYQENPYLRYSVTSLSLKSDYDCKYITVYYNCPFSINTINNTKNSACTISASPNYYGIITGYGKSQSVTIAVKTIMPNMSTQNKDYALNLCRQNSYNYSQSLFVTHKKPKTELKVNKVLIGNRYAQVNERVNLSVDAQGDGLKYEWHYKNPGKEWVVSKMYTSNKYSCVMYPEKSGQEVFCRVIDENKKSIDTYHVNIYGTSTLEIDDNKTNKFYFHADGSLDQNMHQSQKFYHSVGNKTYLLLKIKSNDDWTVSANQSYVQFMNTSGSKISSGKKGESYLLIKLDEYPLTSSNQNRECIVSIKVNDVTEQYTIIQNCFSYEGYTRSGYTDYINKKINNSIYLSEFKDVTNVMSALKCTRLTNGYNGIEIYDDNNSNLYIAVHTRKINSSKIVCEYMVFQIAARSDNDYKLERQLEINVRENKGMSIIQNPNNSFITMNADILVDKELISSQDSRKYAELIGGITADIAGVALDTATYGLDLGASFIATKTIAGLSTLAINLAVPDERGNIQTQTLSGYINFSISKKVELKSLNDTMEISVLSKDPVTANISFYIVSANGTVMQPYIAKRTW